MASGDPLPDGFIIWTRVTQLSKNNDSQLRVVWTVANDPKTGAGAVAAGFVTPSLTAANFDEEAGDIFAASIESQINSRDSGGNNPNPHMKFADLNRHGYIVLTVAPEQVQADFCFLKNILRQSTTESWGGGWIRPVGTHHVRRAAAAAPTAE